MCTYTERGINHINKRVASQSANDVRTTKVLFVYIVYQQKSQWTSTQIKIDGGKWWISAACKVAQSHVKSIFKTFGQSMHVIVEWLKCLSKYDQFV